MDKLADFIAQFDSFGYIILGANILLLHQRIVKTNGHATAYITPGARNFD
jgi:hypothetical protein